MAGLDLGHVEHLVDQARQTLGLADDDGQELLALRLEEAQLLNYPNFGMVSLVPKMADSPQQVTDFLRELARKARPALDAHIFARTDDVHPAIRRTGAKERR